MIRSMKYPKQKGYHLICQKNTGNASRSVSCPVLIDQMWMNVGGSGFDGIAGEKMEAAARVFAGEFNLTTLGMGVNEPGGTTGVITPGGLRCTRLFLSGALTSVEGRKGEGMHARMADPTGVFGLSTDWRDDDISSVLTCFTPPVFVTAIGMARLFRRGGKVIPGIALSDIREAGRDVRDSWVIHTAADSLTRLRALRAAMSGGPATRDIHQAISHYRHDRQMIRGLAGIARSALDQITPVSGGVITQPDDRDIIYEILTAYSGPRGMAVTDLIARASTKGLDSAAVDRVLKALVQKDDCYQPSPGIIKLL
jgi:RPA family protein